VQSPTLVPVGAASQDAQKVSDSSRKAAAALDNTAGGIKSTADAAINEAASAEDGSGEAAGAAAKAAGKTAGMAAGLADELSAAAKSAATDVATPSAVGEAVSDITDRVGGKVSGSKVVESAQREGFSEGVEQGLKQAPDAAVAGVKSVTQKAAAAGAAKWQGTPTSTVSMVSMPCWLHPGPPSPMSPLDIHLWLVAARHCVRQ
jgi:hypothetical protein